MRAGSGEVAATDFADTFRPWIEAGARLIGGCCGTNPAHIRALAALALDTSQLRTIV